MSAALDEKWAELVADGRAEWMSGMRERVSGWRWSFSYFIEQGSRTPQTGNCIEGVPDPVPDLRDPATLGCLLALVRKRWKDDRISLVFNVVYGTWMVLRPDDAAPDGKRLIGFGPTEAAALLAALEVAP